MTTEALIKLYNLLDSLSKYYFKLDYAKYRYFTNQKEIIMEMIKELDCLGETNV